MSTATDRERWKRKAKRRRARLIKQGLCARCGKKRVTRYKDCGGCRQDASLHRTKQAEAQPESTGLHR